MALNEKLGDVFIYDDFISLAVPATRQNQQLIAVLQVPLSHALSHFSHLNVQLFILALVFSLLAGVAALFLARSVTRPVTLLATIARRIAGGFYSTPIAVNSADELGDLARSFAQMQQKCLTQSHWLHFLNRHLQK